MVLADWPGPWKQQFLNSFEVHLDAATKQQTENRHFSSSSGKIRLQA